jgi:hypothetical protein
MNLEGIIAVMADEKLEAGAVGSACVAPPAVLSATGCIEGAWQIGRVSAVTGVVFVKRADN